jgi:hypothetical protein
MEMLVVISYYDNFNSIISMVKFPRLTGDIIKKFVS